MKKYITLSFLAALTLFTAIAQSPKYVLFEHFTNTRCGICGATNPTFYQNININGNAKLHHISIHSSVPYSACVFYQANTVPQDARATFYGLPGTPRVSINGGTTVNANGIDAATVDNAYCATCSPVQVKVTETDNGSSRSANIQVKSIGTPPSGNYRLLVAVVEKTINYNAPNGENVHHNVFRQFLTATSGDALSLAAQGGETVVNYNYTLNGAWAADQIYVLAWLYDETTKAVLNSGTKFDSQIIPIELDAWKGSVVSEKNYLEWTTLTERNTDFFDIERSADGGLFAAIGRVKAAGNASSPLNYGFYDEKPLPNASYYRLKTVDIDGSVSVSKIITLLRKTKMVSNFKVFPSITTQTLNISYIANNNTTISDWRILDGFGKVVQQFSRPLKNPNNDGVSIEIFDVSGLPTGLYFVQLIQNNETTMGRFLKANK